MKHPPIAESDDDEVTAVTHELNQLRAAAAECKKAAKRVVRASDSLVKSLTPPAPMPAVRHCSGPDCDGPEGMCLCLCRACDLDRKDPTP